MAQKSRERHIFQHEAHKYVHLQKTEDQEGKKAPKGERIRGKVQSRRSASGITVYVQDSPSLMPLLALGAFAAFFWLFSVWFSLCLPWTVMFGCGIALSRIISPLQIMFAFEIFGAASKSWFYYNFLLIMNGNNEFFASFIWDVFLEALIGQFLKGIHQCINDWHL